MTSSADPKEAFREFEKFFNSEHLSDVTLIVGENKFPAHRIVLARGSEVFDRMLSQKWHNNKKEIELKEEDQCIPFFSTFLRFFYSNHAVLQHDNTLPLLVLADKYNFTGLQNVCIEYAINYILSEVCLKEVVNVWFNYASKACHPTLTTECVKIIALNAKEIMSAEDWETDWMALDRDQLIEVFKSNDLVIPNEHFLYQAFIRWQNAPKSPERRGVTADPSLMQILPWIRFPFMTAEELHEIETSPLYAEHAKIFQPCIHVAYKYLALPLNFRSLDEFNSCQFLLRSYTDTRWDKRIVLTNQQLYDRGIDHMFKISTRSSTVPVQTWNWALKFTVASTFPNADNELLFNLACDNMDQHRSVEFLVAVVSDKKILRHVSGKKYFTKTRYHTDLDLQSVVEVGDLYNNDAQLLVNGNLYLQLTLRPIV